MPNDSLHTSSTTSSLFEDHLLNPSGNKPIIHLTAYDYLPATILFLSFVLFVILYVYNRKRLNQMIKAFYLNRVANQLMREEVSFVNRTSVILSFVAVVCLSMFAFQLIDFYGMQFPFGKNQLLWIIPSTITGIYFLKIVVVKFMGYVFKTGTEADGYIYTILLFINTLGLFLLPVVIGIEFVKQAPPRLFIDLGYLIISAFLCTRMIRGVIIGINSTRVSGLYLFFYLCTLEILPLFILIKVFLLIIK